MAVLRLAADTAQVLGDVARERRRAPVAVKKRYLTFIHAVSFVVFISVSEKQ